MKKFSAVLIAVLFTFTMMSGCKKSSSSSEGKYELKAGSYTYSIAIPGIGPMDSVTYFDDYGSKECRESQSEIKMFGMSIKQHSRSITKDGYMYNLDMIKKTGTKTKIDAMMPDMKAGYAAMVASMKDKMDIKELGTEDFLGKTCKKIQISQKGGASLGTYWIWKNITLKMENKDPKSGMAFTMAATKVEELPSIPADKFEIPSDFKITEVKMPAGQMMK